MGLSRRVASEFVCKVSDTVAKCCVGVRGPEVVLASDNHLLHDADDGDAAHCQQVPKLRYRVLVDLGPEDAEAWFDRSTSGVRHVLVAYALHQLVADERLKLVGAADDDGGLKEESGSSEASVAFEDYVAEFELVRVCSSSGGSEERRVTIFCIRDSTAWDMWEELFWTSVGDVWQYA